MSECKLFIDPRSPRGMRVRQPVTSREWTELSKDFPKARFCHLGTDATDLRLVLDTFPIFESKTIQRPKGIRHA